MPAFVLRPATASDLDGGLSFWRRPQRQRTAPTRLTGLRLLLGHDTDALILADEAGELVGSVIASWDGWRCHVYRLAIRPDRHHGIGRALLNTAERRFVLLGGRRAGALVLDGNDLGRKAWAAG